MPSTLRSRTGANRGARGACWKKGTTRPRALDAATSSSPATTRAPSARPALRKQSGVMQLVRPGQCSASVTGYGPRRSLNSPRRARSTRLAVSAACGGSACQARAPRRRLPRHTCCAGHQHLQGGVPLEDVHVTRAELQEAACAQPGAVLRLAEVHKVEALRPARGASDPTSAACVVNARTGGTPPTPQNLGPTGRASGRRVRLVSREGTVCLHVPCQLLVSMPNSRPAGGQSRHMTVAKLSLIAA